MKQQRNRWPINLSKNHALYLIELIENDLEDYSDEIDEREMEMILALKDRLITEILDRPDRR